MNTAHMLRMGVGVAMVSLIAVAGATQGMSVAQAAEKSTTATKKADEKKTGAYIGSTESKKYHKPSCKWVSKISKAHRVEFASLEDAKKAGYTPCKVCLPEKGNADSTTSSSSKTKTKESKTGQ